MPERIQRRRTKGYKLPAGAVYVGRPTRWGNPFKVGDPEVPDRAHAVSRLGTLVLMRSWGFPCKSKPNYPAREEIRRELAGRDLACWCPLPAEGEPDQCHGALLIRIANEENPDA